MNVSTNNQISFLLVKTNPEVANHLKTECERMWDKECSKKDKRVDKKDLQKQLVDYVSNQLLTYKHKPSDYPKLFAAFKQANEEQYRGELQINPQTGYLAATLDRLNWQIFVDAIQILTK